MGKRLKNGKLVRVSAPQTVGEGRASRAKNARPLELRRLDGEEGALAKLVFALSDPALFGEDCPAKDKAAERIRAARKRVRHAVGDEVEAKKIFAHAVVSAGERRILTTAHPTLQPHLVEQAVGAVKTCREFHVESWTACTDVAVASRLLATGLALLDVGSKKLDVEVLKAAAVLVGQGVRMREGALDTDRRAKDAGRERAALVQRAAFTRVAPVAPPADVEPGTTIDDEDDDEDQGDVGRVSVSPASERVEAPPARKPSPPVPLPLTQPKPAPVIATTTGWQHEAMRVNPASTGPTAATLSRKRREIAEDTPHAPGVVVEQPLAPPAMVMAPGLGWVRPGDAPSRSVPPADLEARAREIRERGQRDLQRSKGGS